MKIGILGGSFDPIHNGHLIIAEYARTELNLDKVIFMPSGIHPFKGNQKMAEADKRVEMVSLAIESNIYFEKDDFEIVQNNITYTKDTLIYLNKKYKDEELYFIIGSDIIFQLEKWKNFNRLIELCKFVLFIRPEDEMDKIHKKVTQLNELYEIDLEIIPAPLINISSTLIKERIRDRQSIKYLVPELVEDFIKKENLYLGEKINV